jgi:hypothetical protein
VDLLTRYESSWKWLLTGSKARPRDLRSRFTTTLVAAVPIHQSDGEAWELRCARVTATSNPVLFFTEDGWLALDQPAFSDPAPASKYVDTDDDIQWDPASAPENRELIEQLKSIGAWDDSEEPASSS